MLRNHHRSEKKMSLPPYYLVHHLFNLLTEVMDSAIHNRFLSAQVLFYDRFFDTKQAIKHLILGIFAEQYVCHHEKFKSFKRKTNAVGSNSTMQL